MKRLWCRLFGHSWDTSQRIWHCNCCGKSVDASGGWPPMAYPVQAPPKRTTESEVHQRRSNVMNAIAIDSLHRDLQGK